MIGTVSSAARINPSNSQRWQSRMSRAPKLCDTSVSRPSITAMPKIAKAMCNELPTPDALIASGPNEPTMIVSTTPIVIQPSSAITTGTAILSIGMNSVRIEAGTGTFHSSRISRESLIMRSTFVAAALVLSIGTLSAQVGSQPGSGFTTVLSSGMRYAMNYEQQFALLAAEEHYDQQILRPPNPGSNLSRSNPGGGMQGGGPISQ